MAVELHPTAAQSKSRKLTSQCGIFSRNGLLSKITLFHESTTINIVFFSDLLIHFLETGHSTCKRKKKTN